jgi:hypothetical protein
MIGAVALSVVAVAYGATKGETQRREAEDNACGALMSDPEAFEAMQDLRAEHRQEMQAWSEHYGSDPSSGSESTRLPAAGRVKFVPRSLRETSRRRRLRLVSRET